MQLVGGEICVVLNILMFPSLEKERNCKSLVTWESNDRISTTRPLINSSTEWRVEMINTSAWGHLNPSSYCDVGRLFLGGI